MGTPQSDEASNSLDAMSLRDIGLGDIDSPAVARPENIGTADKTKSIPLDDAVKSISFTGLPSEELVSQSTIETLSPSIQGDQPSPKASTPQSPRKASNDELSLEEEINRFRKSAADDDQETAALALFALAHALHRRFVTLNRTDDLQEEVATYRRCLDLSDFTQITLPAILDHLGGILVTLYRRTQNSAHLDESVIHLRRALELCAPSYKDQATRKLAFAVEGQYHCYSISSYFQEAMLLYREVLILRSTGHVYREQSLEDLIRLSQGHADTPRPLDNLRDMISWQKELMQLRQSRQSPESVDDNVYLAQDLESSFTRHGSVGDLNEAIELRRKIVEIHVEDHAKIASALGCLAFDLVLHYQESGNLEELLEAIHLYREAVSFRPSGSADRAFFLNALGRALVVSFQAKGDLQQLAEGIQLLRDALTLNSAKPLDRTATLRDLAASLGMKFEETGDPTDLEDSISYYRSAVKEYPKDSGYPADYVLSLGVGLARRFRETGEPSDLEESIQHLRDALGYYPSGSPTRFVCIANLAAAVGTRYRGYRTGEEGAERIHFTAVSLRRAQQEVSSGTDAARLATLEEAISLIQEALAVCNNDNPQRHNLVDTLAVALELHFRRSGDSAELDRSLELHEEALELRAPGHPLRYRSLIGCSDAYDTRFLFHGASKDAEAGMKLISEALDLLPLGRVARSECLIRRAVLRLRGDSLNFSLPLAMRDMADALADPHRNAQLRLGDVTQLLGALETLFSDGRALPGDHRASLLQIYQSAVQLLPRVAYFGLDVRSRFAVLQRAQDLATKGAVHALLLDRPGIAVEMLEEGRAVFWSQALRLRTQFDVLPAAFANDLLQTSRQLEKESHRRAAPSTKELLEEDSASRRRLNEKFESLVERVRFLPGLERFMTPERFSSLKRVAQNGTVVLLVPGETSCHAICITDSTQETVHVTLPSTSRTRLRELSVSLQQSNKTGREMVEEDRHLIKKVAIEHSTSAIASSGAIEVLQELWKSVVRVILDALSLKKVSPGARPRLWWCPTGAFIFLPVHAAGIYTAEGECCADFVISSYTPTLGTLLNARRRVKAPIRSEAKVLLAGVPNPFQGASIPFAAEEIALVKSLLPDSALLPLPAKDDCTSDSSSSMRAETLLALLPRAAVLHLASHGHQHATDALASGFVMQDGMLTVGRLMELDSDLPHAFFAFLSACETAQGDRTQPDQTVHLAAAMVFVGFGSIVGTMWSMGDVDGPEVAKEVYTALFRGESERLDADAIPRALDNAVRRLRERGMHPSRWATYIHIGI